MKCARHGCDVDIPPTKVGRPRKYCSDACRSAEQRARDRRAPAERWASAVSGTSGEAALVNPEGDLDTQVVAVVHETIMLRNTYARLGRDARVELAVRCESMAKAIGDGLIENFRGAIGDE